MILNLIETLKTSIYSTKHTNNTKSHFTLFKQIEFSKNTYYSKNKFE